MYQIGVVGCGVIGSRFADAVVRHDRTTIRACCDIDEQRSRTFSTEYGCEAYTDYENLVADRDIDVVYVGVPPAAHREVTRAAIDAGAHVICEKPIAPDADTGADLVDAAAESDRVTAVNLPFRYRSGFRDMVACIDRGAIGDPKRIELRFRFPQWPREWQDVDWLRSQAQGGPLREVGTHFIFAVQELFGGIDRVAADVEYSAPDRYESSIVGYFTADGVPGTIDLLCDVDVEEENSISVTGETSILSFQEWHKLIEHRRDSGRRILTERDGDTMTMLLDEFVAELDGDGGDLVSFEEANSVQRVVDAIFESEGSQIDPGA